MHDEIQEKTPKHLRVKGKFGYVVVDKLEKHKVNKYMMFIKLDSGLPIFCQENHPLWIRRESSVHDEDREIYAGDLNLFEDSIWCDDSFIQKTYTTFIPKTSPQEVFSIIDGIDNFVSVCFRYIRGDSKNLRLHPKFLQFDKNWLEEFVELFKQKSLVKIKSFSLLQQMIFICKKIDYYYDYFVVDDENGAYFMFKVFGKSENVSVNVGYCKIADITKVFNFQDFVFDVKTESQEFILGGVQNHNSFHLGGAVSVQTMNIIPNIIENVESFNKDKVSKHFRQEKDDLVLTSNVECAVIVDKEAYASLDVIRTDEYIELPVCYFQMSVDSTVVSVTIEEPVKIYLTSDVEETDRFLNIHFLKDDKILHIKPTQKDYTKLAEDIDASISGKYPWFNDPAVLYIKFMKKFVLDENFDSVHLEVVLSNILRDTTDPQYPARLREPYTPKLFSIKTLPGLISWPLGLCFENFGQAISRGMISQDVAPSSIEKVLIGESLIDEKKRKEK